MEQLLNQKLNFIDRYISASNAADGSKFDANANVSVKNIATMATEIHKDINIAINRRLMCQMIAELYDEDLAKEYMRQLESHEIYRHDETSLMPYCVSITMYPFLMNGLKALGGESGPPKHLESFCGSFINLVFAISSQFAGAVATVEFLTYFDHFARKDLGDNYLDTHAHIITQHFQHVVYTLNQPAAARGYQSVFWNISVYDRPYFESIFENFMFPGEDEYVPPSWESVKKLQEFFLTWFNAEREKAVLTFPVITAGMLVKDGAPVDTEFEDMCANQLAAGNSFFIYESESADSLASCCFKGDEIIHVNGIEISIADFVNSRTEELNGEGVKICGDMSIDSMNPETHLLETTRITGVLKKQNEHARLIEIRIGQNVNRVTPDHIFLALDKHSNMTVEVSADEIMISPDRYMLPVLE